VTAIGTVPDGGMVRRGGALAGDRIIVTGAIGDAAIGLRLRTDPALADRLSLSEGERNALLRRYLLPEPRMAAAGVLLDHASGAMDISDGLVGDLEKMAAASGVGIEIDAGHVPLSAAVRQAVTTDPSMLELALTGGDDYEIAASVPAAAVAPVLRLLQENGILAAVIGGVTAGEGVVVTAPEGGRMVFGKGSYAHF
jgi:thiamine-monophosphate kinase